MVAFLLWHVSMDVDRDLFSRLKSRSPFGQKIAGRSRSQNSAMEIAKTEIFCCLNGKLAFYNNVKICLR